MVISMRLQLCPFCNWCADIYVAMYKYIWDLYILCNSCKPYNHVSPKLNHSTLLCFLADVENISRLSVLLWCESNKYNKININHNRVGKFENCEFKSFTECLKKDFIVKKNCIIWSENSNLLLQERSSHGIFSSFCIMF